MYVLCRAIVMRVFYTRFTRALHTIIVLYRHFGGHPNDIRRILASHAARRYNHTNPTYISSANSKDLPHFLTSK